MSGGVRAYGPNTNNGNMDGNVMKHRAHVIQRRGVSGTNNCDGMTSVLDGSLQVSLNNMMECEITQFKLMHQKVQIIASQLGLVAKWHAE